MNISDNKSIDYYLKSPTNFMISNHSKLLPDWPIIPLTMVIVFLKAKYPLEEEDINIDREKQRLLQQFLDFGKSIYSACQQQNLLVEVISPQNGYPLYSSKGDLVFDLVTIVHDSLNFKIFPTNQGCKVLQHPFWNTAVYPGLILSTASLDTFVEKDFLDALI